MRPSTGVLTSSTARVGSVNTSASNDFFWGFLHSCGTFFTFIEPPWNYIAYPNSAAKSTINNGVRNYLGVCEFSIKSKKCGLLNTQEHRELMAKKA
jgi:hypothetical protein